MNVKEIKRWLKDRSVRQWKRILFFLCETGEPQTCRRVTDALQIARSNAWRGLKRHELRYEIKLEKKARKCNG